MTLNFTNQSRSYDATRQAVRFWGYDGAREVSFFVTDDALRRLELWIGAQLGLSAVFGAVGAANHAACRTRARSRSCLARPYICRLISFR